MKVHHIGPVAVSSSSLLSSSKPRFECLLLLGSVLSALPELRTASLDEHKLESRLPEVYADDTTLMAESKEELKSLLMKVKEEIEKGVGQGYILSPCLFNLYAVYIMQNARLDEA